MLQPVAGVTDLITNWLLPVSDIDPKGRIRNWLQPASDPEGHVMGRITNWLQPVLVIPLTTASMITKNGSSHLLIPNRKSADTLCDHKWLGFG